MKVLVDTREQTPFRFDMDGGIETERATLHTGDYSLAGYEAEICVERKSLADFVNCCGGERERFKRELRRMEAFLRKAVIIEASLQDIVDGKWLLKHYRRVKDKPCVGPSHVLGAIASWRSRYGVEFIYAGNHALGAEECYRFFKAFEKQCREFTINFEDGE